MTRKRKRPNAGDENEAEVPKLKWFEIYKAFVLAVLGSVLLGVSEIAVKSVQYMTVSQLAFVRYLGLFVFNLPLLQYRREVVFNKFLVPYLFGRAVFGCASLYLDYVGIKLIPIAEATVITSTTPVWVTLLACVFLKERLDRWNTISIIVCMIGLVLMSRIFLTTSVSAGRYSDITYWYGCSASLGCALCNAFIYVFLRRLKEIHPTVTIAYESVTGVTLMALLEIIFWKFSLPECGEDSVKVILLAVLTFLGQLAFTAAFKYEKAGPIAVIHESSYVVVSFFVQTLYFKDLPDVCSILAAFCVVISIVLSAARKVLQRNYQMRRNEKVKKETEV